MNASLARLIYRALQWVGSPLLLLYFLWRILRDRRYLRRFHERLGFLPHGFRQQTDGAIWLHAVSVGEVLSLVTLLRRLKGALPGVPLFVSCSTLAGRDLAEQRLADFADGVFYAPIDYCFAVRRVLRTLRPALVLVAETEIWPNLFFETKRNHSCLMIINGRISDAAMPRYRRYRWFFRLVLALPDRILAQSAVSRQRFLDLGAPPDRVEDAGNLKYDFSTGEAQIPPDLQDFLDALRPDPIWIAASTMPPAAGDDVDEDDAVLRAFAELARDFPRLLLILAPRKPERFSTAAQKLQAAGIPFARRTELPLGVRLDRLPGVLLLDSIGELASLFRLDGVVFMGGSLARRGGHNVLEPGFFGKALVFGPHMENFPEIADEFRRGGACIEIAGPQDLSSAIRRLLADPSLCRTLGEKARRLSEARRGATDRVLEAVLRLHGQAVPLYRPPFPLCPLLWLLAKLWAAGGRLKAGWDLAKRRRLNTPVISVGNLAMGGAGKTPFVLWLARRLREAGLRPGILTRGYRRVVPEKQTLAGPGAALPVARTGDEAQILLRAAVAPLGIGADRYSAGRALESQFHPDILILDDGFQHLRLARDLDIVLVDALDPFGGGSLFPLGRLREPPAALARADVLVLTRTVPGRSYEGLIARLRELNPDAPILKARVRPEAWIHCETGEALPPERLPAKRVAAFCALANPASFWNTLHDLGYQPLVHRTLGDHHRYRPTDLVRLAEEARGLGAEAMVTTEKDCMNLCEGACDLVRPLGLYWLRIDLQVEGGEKLIDLIRNLLCGIHMRER